MYFLRYILPAQLIEVSKAQWYNGNTCGILRLFWNYIYYRLIRVINAP